MTRQEIQKYHHQTARETYDRILHGTTPWVAVGDFLDDWRRAPAEKRSALVEEPIADFHGDAEMRKWAALCAGIVEWLCWNERLPFPSWTSSREYDLPEP